MANASMLPPWTLLTARKLNEYWLAPSTHYLERHNHLYMGRAQYQNCGSATLISDYSILQTLPISNPDEHSTPFLFIKSMVIAILWILTIY